MNNYTETSKKVTCVHAGTSWYKVGEKYTVYTNPAKPFSQFVKASDGFFDDIRSTVSKFKKYKGDKE